MRELTLKKCNHCGAVVKVLNDCKCDDCGIKCCGDNMIKIEANSTDASFEKHVPNYEINGDKLIASVNHVMDEDHYIEWISLVTNDKEETIYFKPGDEAKATFENTKEGILYAYCNKHGLWKKEIK